MSGVYADYVKQTMIYEYIKEMYKDELEDDVNVLGKRLAGSSKKELPLLY